MPTAVPVKPVIPLASTLKRRAQALVQPVTPASPVSSNDIQLPEHALASIIRDATLAHPAATSNHPTTDSKQAQATILAVSHVSSLWRGVSLSIPAIWLNLLVSELDSDVNEAEHPTYSRKPWLNELFRRSDPLPIDIGLGGYSYLPRDPFLVALELENIHRIRIYRVLVDERGWETLSSCLDDSAPMLESLSVVYKPSTLKTSGHIGFEQSQDDAAAPQLPKMLFGGHAPRLTKLSLRGCLPSQADFLPSIRANLTSLTVSQVSGPGIPTADRWLAYLAGMPRLEHLALKEGAIAMSGRQRRSSQSKAVPAVVELPVLRTLSLEGHINAMAIVLQRLHLRDDALVAVVCSEVLAQEGIDAVVEAFARGFEHSAMAAADGEGEAVPFISLKGTEARLEVTDGTRHRRIALTFSHDALSSVSIATPLWESCLSKIMAKLPLTISTATALEVQLPASPPFFIKALSGACQLERLVNLTATTVQHLLPPLQKEAGLVSPSSSPLLGSNSSSSLSALTPLPSLPALHTLHFSSNEAFWGSAWHYLEAYLKWRALGWRAIRQVQVPPTGGVPVEAEKFLRRLNISLIYGH